MVSNSEYKLERLLEYIKYNETYFTSVTPQQHYNIPLKDLINFNNQRKIETIKELSWFLYKNSIDTERQLHKWLCEPDNEIRISEIYGVGPKTIDYLKMLVGIETIPIDRHLFSFVKLAGLTINTYEEASLLYCQAADALKISRYELDKKIWGYMSNK